MQWCVEEIVRDLWQNFYDGNRTCLERIVVRVDGLTTEVFAPATMDLDAAFYLGSNKSVDNGDIGQFGEGLKASRLRHFVSCVTSMPGWCLPVAQWRFES